MQSPLKHANLNQTISRNELDYKAIYVTCFPIVRNMIQKNSGSLDDAKDIFQESVLILYQNTGKDNFKLNSAICTYLYSIARNKWLQQMRNKGHSFPTDDHQEPIEDKPPFDDDEVMQKQRLLIKYLNNLGDKCQNILKLYFEGIPGEKIANELNFSSYDYYRLAKNRCIENLKKMIHEDPVFKELTR